jgi:CheY-like chemotaxis protein
MEPATVLVIEEGAEAALVCAALAKQPDLRVLDAPDIGRALKRLKGSKGRVAVAIVGPDALAKSGAQLMKKLETRGIPIVVVASSLTPSVRQRALAAGVREVHERPQAWQPYSQFIESLVGRFRS